MSCDITPLALTDEAKAALTGHYGGGPRPVLRVFLSFMHESGPRLELAEDNPCPEDTLLDADGWQFAVNTLLLDQAAPLMVDVGPEGFWIHSTLDFSEAGGNCGGDCGSH